MGETRLYRTHLRSRRADASEDDADEHGRGHREHAGLDHLSERARGDDGDASRVVGLDLARHDARVFGELSSDLGDDFLRASSDGGARVRGEEIHGHRPD
eukprot:18953-Pelagococcus_subviridis.AAC.1